MSDGWHPGTVLHRKLSFHSDSSALIKLEGVDDEQQARRFTNTEVFFPKKHAEGTEDEDLTWAYFTGFIIKDVKEGKIGKVTDVDDSTINTLFVVDRDGKELLIPAQEDFIVNLDREARIITMDLPSGLIED